MTSWPSIHPHPSAGFTLLELLVAISVFAVMATMAYGGLETVTTTSKHVNDTTQRLAKLQTAFLILQQDAQQAVDRGVRDALGTPVPALSGGLGPQLELTRGGWHNPLRLPRSTLLRVGYRLEDERLIRATWPVLDRAQDSTPMEAVLLDGIETVSFRFFGKEWTEVWPPVRDAGGAGALPKAIEIVLRSPDFETVRRTFLVNG